MADTKAAGEVKSLEMFYQMLQLEPAKAFYGKNHIIKAAEAQAVETLLISDNLFRWVDFLLTYTLNHKLYSLKYKMLQVLFSFSWVILNNIKSVEAAKLFDSCRCTQKLCCRISSDNLACFLPFAFWAMVTCNWKLREECYKV